MSQTSRNIVAEDEQGRRWMVYENDTAWDLCLRLSKKGLSQIVMPTATFLRGELSYPSGLIDVNSLPLEVVRENDGVKEIVRRVIRLKDCLAFLKIQEKADA